VHRYVTHYHVLDALIAAGLLAFTAACFRQGGLSTGLFLLLIVLGSGYLGFKTGARLMYREIEWAKKNNP